MPLLNRNISMYYLHSSPIILHQFPSQPVCFTREVFSGYPITTSGMTKSTTAAVIPACFYLYSERKSTTILSFKSFIGI